MQTDILPLPSWDSEATWATFKDGLFHGVFGGVEIQKSADDLDRYRELVEISQPDIVVETGTRAGGSALWFHRELSLQVVTIDTTPQFVKRGGPPHTGPGIEWVRGSSISQSVMARVLPLLRGKRVMVSLDSDHHSAHVQAEIAIWGPLVSPGCYLVVEDACFDMWEPDRARVGGAKIPEQGGALDAIRRQLGPPLGQTAPFFWRDMLLEALTPISHSPCGWWRRHE